MSTAGAVPGGSDVRDLPTFHHADAGTPEHRWLTDPRWASVPALQPADLLDVPGQSERLVQSAQFVQSGQHEQSGQPGEHEQPGQCRQPGPSGLRGTPDGHVVVHVVVLAAHPDDETLGVGATLADLAATGVDIDVVVATDGESSHPDSTLWPPSRLAAARREEVAHALNVLAPQARLHLLGLPDGGLATAGGALTDAAQAVLPQLGPGTLVLAPVAGDGHPDHDAAAATARNLADRTGARLLHYPIWWWQWGTPDTLDWPTLLAVTPTAGALRAKRAAIAAHTTQVNPLSPLPGDETLLPPHVLARFERVIEVLVDPARAADARTPSASADARRPGASADAATTATSLDTPTAKRRAQRTADLDAVAEDDPWEETSWYERRKRALTLALLARERYADVLDIGCSTGALTAELATRADRITAIDPSERALAVARRRGLVGVRWLRGEAPYDLPDGPVDLVLASEIGYFLTGAELLGLLRHAAQILRPGGEIVLVDWRPPTQDIPLDGELVHDQATRMYDGLLVHRAGYVDSDVRIDCWGGPECLGPHRSR